jgi:hypothetical protein
MDTVFTIVYGIASIVGLIGWVLLLIAGFKRSVWWGLGIFFIWPICIVFAIKYWDEARAGCLVSLVSGVMAVGIVLAYWDSMAAMVEMMDPSRAQQSSSFDNNISNSVSTTTSSSGSSNRTSSSVAPSSATQTSDDDVEPKKPVRRSATKFAFQDTDFDFLGGQIGSRVKLITKDGRTHDGQVLGVSGDAVQIRKRASGGTIDFKVYKRDVKTVQVYERLQE